MPFRDPDKMASYMRDRYHNRRKAAFKFLGDKCAECSKEKDLQLDHIDPQKKRFSMSQLRAVTEEKFWEEIRKCQLLCSKCHREKTLRDQGKISARETHGTLSAYRYCGPPRCDACKKARADYMKEYDKRRANNAG